MPTPSSLRPEVYPDRIALLNPAGEHECWVTEETARELIKKHQVRIVRKHGRVRVLIMFTGIDYNSLTGGRGSALDKTRYSHNHETEHNPENVWTLKRLPRSTQDVFLEVASNCGGVTVHHPFECATCHQRVVLQYRPPINYDVLPGGWMFRRSAYFCSGCSGALQAAA